MGVLLPRRNTVRAEGDHWRSRLRGPEGSPAFNADYDAAHRAFEEASAAAAPRHTVSRAIATYKASAAFTGLSENTKRNYDYYLRLEADWGALDVEAVSEFAVDKLRNKLSEADNPDVFNGIRKTANLVWRGYRKKKGAGPEDEGIEGLDNPWSESRRLKVEDSEQNRAWPSDVLLRVFAAATPEFRALMTCVLLSSQRIGDVVKWPPDAWDRAEGVLAFRQEKTGKRLRMHLPPPLQAAFEAMAGRVPGRLLCTPRGVAWKKVNAEETLLNLREFLELERYVLHGLRTMAATAALELGFSLQECMSVTGHTDVRQFLDYCRGADTAALSAPVLEALAARFEGALAPGRGGGKADGAGPVVTVNNRRFSGVTGRAAAKARREAAIGKPVANGKNGAGDDEKCQ